METESFYETLLTTYNDYGVEILMWESVVTVLETLEKDGYSAMVKGGNTFVLYSLREETTTHFLHIASELPSLPIQNNRCAINGSGKTLPARPSLFPYSGKYRTDDTVVHPLYEPVHLVTSVGKQKKTSA
jgi:hypothetical protein